MTLYATITTSFKTGNLLDSVVYSKKINVIEPIALGEWMLNCNSYSQDKGKCLLILKFFPGPEVKMTSKTNSKKYYLYQHSSRIKMSVFKKVMEMGEEMKKHFTGKIPEKEWQNHSQQLLLVVDHFNRRPVRGFVTKWNKTGYVFRNLD